MTQTGSTGPAAALAPEAARRLCALLTCFNRREHTLAALAALRACAMPAGWTLHAVLVDDASRDGTAAAVTAAHPWVQVVSGAGDLFWCRGMHQAFSVALAQGFDAYLWLNDDTRLETDALARLLHTLDQAEREHPQAAAIVVGSTRDDRDGSHSYGGERRGPWWRPVRFEKVPPRPDAVQVVDTFNGNIVLVGARAARRVGNLDAAYEHAMGDTDYGLRARQAGVQVLLAPGWLGWCRDNPVDGGFRDGGLGVRARLRQMLQRKGLPWRSWWRFTRRHGGPLWLLAFAWPYAKVVLDGLRRRP